MKIDCPTKVQIPELQALWQQVFGDTDAFISAFFSTAFDPQHCRCVTVADQVAAVLYWFDCDYPGGKAAYIYAVATHPDFRNRGLCRSLLKDTHALLAEKGYAVSVLVPGEKGLFEMYEKMGYRCFGGMDRFTAAAGEKIPLREVSPAEYAAARNALLPPGGIRQEGENLAFLSTFAKLYAGDGFVLAAAEGEDGFIGFELLGDRAAAPGILTALGKKSGTFRAPGSKPFAMYLPFTNAPAPEYFGLAFD